MQEGDLRSVRGGGGGYVVAKILKPEEGVVHVRVYAKTYVERRREVAEEDLRLATVFDANSVLATCHSTQAPSRSGSQSSSATRPSSRKSSRAMRSGARQKTNAPAESGVVPEKPEGVAAKLKRLFRRN